MENETKNNACGRVDDFVLKDSKLEYSTQIRRKTLRIAIPTLLLGLVFFSLFVCQLESTLDRSRDSMHSDFSHRSTMGRVVLDIPKNIMETKAFRSPIAFVCVSLLALGVVGICDWVLIVGIRALYFPLKREDLQDMC